MGWGGGNFAGGSRDSEKTGKNNIGQGITRRFPLLLAAVSL